MLVPPALRAGDLVAVVAPSSPFDAERYRRGEAWLASRYRVRVRDDLLVRQGFLAGDDARRLAELNDALHDPEVRAIVAARGGYGATRIVDGVDWAALRASPKWVVGFSDVTALHVEATAVGVASMHAPMVAWLGDCDEPSRERVRAALEEGRLAPWDRLQAVRAGNATGPAFGGNLALLEACAAAGRLRVPSGAILFLEDCTERPYRLDRMLTALRSGGHLSHVAGVVVGDLVDCKPGPDGVTAEEVFRERLSALGVPLVMGAPFGHGERNDPFILGGSVTVEAEGNAGRVSFSERTPQKP